MNRDQSYALIRQTFTQGFDKARFQNFAVNLLNRIDESKAQAWNNTYVKDAFKNHVNRYERLGTYTSPDNEKLEVLIVHLASETKLARARTAIRNFVAHHLKTRDEKDAALVAFVSPTEKQWRLSYVKMEYATVEKESGKVGVETRLTPARRFSYIVGEGESCHTAQTRFLPLLQDTKTNPKLADIEEAFSVEAVTKEFFMRYVELFENIHQALEKLIKKDKSIHDEFQSRNVNTVDFAKKLMGQIVFLYFLQKKGWLGVEKGQDWGTGPHDFLRRMAGGKYGAYENYFNDVLEPLFYDTLATDRGHEAWCRHFKCRIPFLNGGLFEALGGYDWSKIDILLPNRLFTNNDHVEESITGTGVLDVFDRYNFTVNEAEPLEKEVAIDPEMLGKVFENLIEENRRKGLGAYYTPREIVHYMCQESLINYLETALNKEKELVPRKDIETVIHLGDQAAHYEAARMSGTKTYKPELPKPIERHARLIDDKLQDITVCDPAVGSGAFPVGMMTEIVRARSALTPYFNDVHERTPYFFKRHAIQNCLYGVDIDPGAVEIAKLRLWLSLVVDEEDVKQVKPLPNLDYKIVTGNSLLGVDKDLFNNEFFIQLERLKPQYFDETDATKKATLKRKIDDIIHHLTNGKETFDFEIYFSEVFHKKRGFDSVIGNPPYLNFKSYSSGDRENYKRLYPEIFDGKADVYYYFIFKGIRLANEQGFLSFITSRYWLEAEFAAKLRSYISDHYTIYEILDFCNAVIFEQGIKVAITSITRKRSFEAPFRSISYIGKKFEGLKPDKLDVILVLQSKLLSSDHRWIFVNSDGADLLSKLSKDSVPLDEIAFCKQGIVTGRDRAFVFEQSAPLPELPRCLLKPWVKVGDVYRYSILPVKKRYLVYTNDIAKISDYPKFHDGLKEHSIKLKTRREVRNGRIRWFDLQWPREKRFFESEKLICRFKASGNTFAYDDRGYFCSADITLVVLKKEFRSQYSTKYLLALLNSRLLDYHFKTYAKLMDYRYEYYPTPVSLMRIRQAGVSQQKVIVGLVDKILDAKKSDPEADTTVLEQEIDQLVYELYGLTEEEIAIIEGKSS